MTRDLPQVFEKFGNIVTDVKLVIELHKIKNKQMDETECTRKGKCGPPKARMSQSWLCDTAPSAFKQCTFINLPFLAK
jgi:hypothetical protein